MTDTEYKGGPLPEPADELAHDDGFNVIDLAPVFTAEQMRAYAAQEVAAERERRAMNNDTESRVREVMRLALHFAVEVHVWLMALPAADQNSTQASPPKVKRARAALESAVRALAEQPQQPLGASASGPGYPLGSDAAIRLWHEDTESHKRVSAFEWFAAGILAAERTHGIRPLPTPPAVKG